MGIIGAPLTTTPTRNKGFIRTLLRKHVGFDNNSKYETFFLVWGKHWGEPARILNAMYDSTTWLHIFGILPYRKNLHFQSMPSRLTAIYTPEN